MTDALLHNWSLLLCSGLFIADLYFVPRAVWHLVDVLDDWRLRRRAAGRRNSEDEAV